MMDFNSTLKSCVYCVSLAILMACGGDNKRANVAPTIDSQDLEVQFAQPLTFDVTASDNNGDKLSYTIARHPQHGKLVYLGENRYTYQPEQGQVIPASFIISVSDGKLSAKTAINVAIIDDNPFQLISHLPAANEAFYSNSGQLTLNFNSVSALPENSQDYSCEHTIGLINQANEECVPVRLSLAANKKQLVIEPQYALPAVTRFSLNIHQTHRNFVGAALIKDYQVNFATAAKQPVINELILTDFDTDYRWLELYNGTASTINLAHYQISTQALNTETFEVSAQHSFVLPEQTLAPGQYYVVQNAHLPFEWRNGFKSTTERFIVTGEQYMYWSTSGYIELMNAADKQVIDVVKFGDYDSDIHATAWQGDNIATDGINIIYRVNNKEAGQNGASKTNWQLSAYPTAGAINDVACEDDLDKDGIPDCNEQAGTTYAGLPLHQWGARAGQPDIFVEIDYMNSDDPGVRPQWHTLAKVKQVFADNGIAIHFDAGTLFAQHSIAPQDRFNLGGGNEVAYSQSTYFAQSPGQSSVLAYKSEHFALARDNIFHYTLFANSQQLDGSYGSAGYAEINGDDLIITLGGWGLNDANETSRNYLINMQSATLVHELGHNFGLLHGGLDGVNNKPNHLSSMNYDYQLSGIPTIGNNEGDRLMQNRYFPNERCTPFTLVNGPEGDFHKYNIGYSHGVSIELFEGDLDEQIGFGHQASSSIDYNCDGEIAKSPVSVDLDLNSYQDDIFTDYNEWQALELDFNTVKPFDAPPILQQLRDISAAPLEELAPSDALLNNIKRAGL